MNLLFFIGSLKTGGAENQMVRLAHGFRSRGHNVCLVTTYPGGNFWEWVKKKSQVKMVSLFKRPAKYPILRGFQYIFAIKRLRGFIKRESSDFVYSALSFNDLIAWFAVSGLSQVKLIWSLRASNLKTSWKLKIPFQLCRWISPNVSLITANSKNGLLYHLNKGYRNRRITVIYNGIDLDQFRFEPVGRKNLRMEWNVSENKSLIGLVGRLSPMKDHPTFIKAASLLTAKRKDVHFVCVGDGIRSYKEKMVSLCESLGMKERMIWAGDRNDMSQVYSALDIHTSSSFGEGFSNAIGEAMACGVPNVVTDVGDSAFVVGDTGVVVPPGDPQSLSRGWEKILRQDRRQMGMKARKRIIDNFSVERLVDKTLKELSKLT